MAFGPALADGRHLLLATNDNDFNAAQDAKFYAFAIDTAELPGFEARDIAPRADGSCTAENDKTE